MEQNLHIQLEHLTEKIERMNHMGLSKEEFMNSFSKAEVDVLEKAMGDIIEKGKSFPIGTVHNGFKKVGEGDWRKVSERGMTKKEHEDESKFHGERSGKASNEGKKDADYHKLANETEGSKLDDKQYSDEEVVGGEKKEETMKNPYTPLTESSKIYYRNGQEMTGQKKKDYLAGKEKKETLSDIDTPISRMLKDSKKEDSNVDKFLQRHKKTVIDNHDNSEWKLPGDIKSATEVFAKQQKLSESEVSDLQEKGILKFGQVQHKDGMYTNVSFNTKKLAESVQKSIEPTIEKSIDKVTKVMKEFKEGNLKSSSGETVTDHKQAIAIAMSEAGISKSEDNEVEKGGEGSRGGKVIGHTANGNPIYVEHHHPDEAKYPKEERAEARLHRNKYLRDQWEDQGRKDKEFRAKMKTQDREKKAKEAEDWKNKTPEEKKKHKEEEEKNIAHNNWVNQREMRS